MNLLDADRVGRARLHIDTIRREAGLDSGDGSKRNVDNLQNALHTLADELYQKSTHFLVELIQNADDNEYDVDEPSITLTYEDRRLRVDCNERGFSERNVEAICRVGSSTKAGKDRATAYVGEKGIGFKSVFKAADVVWISSNAYTFKFDKRQTLGMIAPIWEAFPGETEASTTSMLLQLSPAYAEKELLSDLKAFDPRMLMFLRRLKKVKIVIHENQTTWETTLRKSVGKSHQETAIELTQDDKTMRYLVSSYNAKKLPTEPKRPGATGSEVILAFPDLAESPDIAPQKVYAFLPIRDYGFKFLLQCDFLLSANREDILDYPPWNITLRQEFVNAFVAVSRSYSHGQLCYIWPRYIPFKPIQSDFFEPARKQIIGRLSKERVLKCRTQELMMPCSLIYVPAQFCDKEGIPMTSTPENDQKYLSQEYSLSLRDNLEALGVKEMTATTFLDHLASFVVREATLFQKQKSVDWHTRLAEILLKLSFDAASHERIVDMPLVPLSDGRWVSAKEGFVYLPQETDSCPPPEGFRLSLVREAAANNPTTRSLYLQLGLRVLGQESIAHGILEEHMKHSFNPYSMTIPQLISQAAFLFHARVDDYRVRRVWFATGKGSARFRAEEVYIPSETRFAASHYFTAHPEIPFLHADYLSAGRDDTSRWCDWLEHVAGLSVLPRLIEPIPKQPGSFRLSSHFSFIMKDREPKDFLVLLRDNWNHYSHWLDDDDSRVPDASRTLSQKGLIKKLQTSQVQCRGGTKEALKDVFLPIPELMDKAQGRLPFIDADDLLDPRWQRLRVLGLGVEGNVRFYLRCLEVMSERKGPTAVDRASMLLEQIQARYSDDEELVRESFKNKPLVCIPNKIPGQTPRWARVQDCLWAGPECLRRFVALKNIYPSCQRLFRDFFRIPDATVLDVVRESKLIGSSDSLAYIKGLFLELEKYLENDETTTQVQSLQTHSIWPVYTTEEEADWDFLGCAKRSDDPWYIADRAHLLESFRGAVPLLAFAVEDIQRMPRLIRTLGGDRRRLTRAAISIAQTVGIAEPDITSQDNLRAKANMIARLIPPRERGKKEKTDKLRNLRVFATSELIQKWAVPVGTELHSGRPKDGNVVVSTEHETLKIYIKKRYFQQNKTPADLVEAIANFCAIEERNWLLLTVALTESLEKTQEWFQRHGIPALNLEDDLPEEIADVDDFDPRKPAAKVHRRTYLTLNLDSDLVGMFLPIGLMDEVRSGSAAVLYNGGESSNGFVLAGDSHAQDLFIEDGDDSDAKSVSSKAGSTWSGTTIGDGGKHDGEKLDGKKKSTALSTGTKIRRTLFGKILALQPVSTVSRVDENLEYIGQKEVSQVLLRMLGEAYDPDVHWTSHLRVRSGHKPFTADRSSDGNLKIYASFTIKDTKKTFTRYLAQTHPHAAKWVVKPPVYHLDVKTTAGGLRSGFSFSNVQMKMARAYTMPRREDGGIPTNVYYLVRVFNAPEKPDVKFLLDPWSLYLADKLRLKAESEYRASFS